MARGTSAALLLHPQLLSKTAQTYSLPLDLNKEFLIPRLTPGSYTVVLEEPVCRWLERELQLTDTTLSLVQIVLQVAANSTTVSVTDSSARDQSYEVMRTQVRP